MLAIHLDRCESEADEHNRSKYSWIIDELVASIMTEPKIEIILKRRTKC